LQAGKENILDQHTIFEITSNIDTNKRMPYETIEYNNPPAEATK